MARKQLKSKTATNVATIEVKATPVEVKKPTVSTKSNIPVSTPDFLNAAKPCDAIPTNWKLMQQLAKECGIKAGGRGVTSDILHHWLCQYAKLGATEFAIKYPEALSNAPKKVDKVTGEKVALAVPTQLAGLSFREAQKRIAEIRDAKIVHGHKGKFNEFCKSRNAKATSWDGIINLLNAINEYAI